MAPDLFIPELQAPVPPAGQGQPRLWIRRLAVFEDEKTNRRDISLKPGLNIVWTPDLSSSGRRSLAHGSGKSTFCRLLRACLGEAEFASETQRHRLTNKLPKGFFAAEVMIDGDCWVTVRSFGLTESFVAKAGSIEDALQRGRRDGDPATLDRLIRDTFFGELSGLVPPEVDDEHIWDVLRSWLSRDQECRLADILSWRSPKTQSRSRAQVLSEAAKLAMVRLAVRALDKQELRAGIEERKLAKKAEEERKRQTFLEEQRKARLKALREAFQVGTEVGLEDTLDQQGLISLAKARFESSMGVDLPKPPEPNSLVAELRALNTAKTARLEEKSQLDSDAQPRRIQATALRSEAEVGEISVKHGSARVCPICRVSINEVLAKGCSISLERCDVDSIKAKIADKQAKAAALDKEAEEAESKSRHVAVAIAEIEKQIQAVEDRLEEVEAEQRKVQNARIQIQDKVFEARRLLDEARALHNEQQEESPAASLNDKLDSLRLDLEEGRGRAREAIARLATQYKAIIAAWLPDGVEGVIKLDGNGLKVDVELEGRGEVSTAALDSLKIVAFDLAVLHLATEGKAILPPFLIHDSPREADLDASLYARLFEMIAGWETESGNPGFQYIVTTTTAPPASLQGDDFVRLKMSSTPEEERLFRADL